MFEPYSLPEMDVLTEDEAQLLLSRIEKSLSAELKSAAEKPAESAGANPTEAILARVLVVKVLSTLDLLRNRINSLL